MCTARARAHALAAHEDGDGRGLVPHVIERDRKLLSALIVEPSHEWLVAEARDRMARRGEQTGKI